MGVNDIVLDSGAKNAKEIIEHNTQVRRSALKKGFKPLGFPILNSVIRDDSTLETSIASVAIAKYASIVIVSSVDPNYASLIMGIPGYDVEDVKMNNITINVKGGAPGDQADIVVPELEKGYPDPQNFGKIPAYGFFIRHVRNIEMSNIELKLGNEDFRPPFILEDVKGASFFNVRASQAKGIPSFVLKNVTDFKTVQCGAVPDKKIDKAESMKL